MLKFLPGIILIQIISSGLLLMGFNWSHDFQLLIIIAFIGLLCAILFAFWFSSIARNISIADQAELMEKHIQDREKILKEAEREKAGVVEEKSQLKEQHAREREKILLDSEREKSTLVTESFRQIEKESKKAHSKANLKVGLAFAATVGAAGVMIFSQLITVGIMFLIASGSGLSGYILRARHERLSRNKQMLLTQKNGMSTPTIEQLNHK